MSKAFDASSTRYSLGFYSAAKVMKRV